MIYYLLNNISFQPISIFLMLPIGFVFSFQIRNKKVYYIDIGIFILLLIILTMIMVPALDFLGIFKRYIVPSSNILSLIIFLFGYYLGYIITKDNNNL